MPTIIRPGEHHRSTQAATFNFEDLARQAKQYLDQVRAEAGKIIAQAQTEAVQIRKQAEIDGRRAAMEAQQQIVAAQLADVLPALRQAIAQIEQSKDGWLRHWEQAAVEVAAAIAARVVRGELTRRPEVPVGLVREALQLAAGNTRVRIALAPADHQRIAEQVQSLVEEMAGLTAAEIVPDPGVSPGGCRVETQFGVIDQQIESQLKRIVEELTD